MCEVSQDLSFTEPILYGQHVLPLNFLDILELTPLFFQDFPFSPTSAAKLGI